MEGRVTCSVSASSLGSLAGSPVMNGRKLQAPHGSQPKVTVVICFFSVCPRRDPRPWGLAIRQQQQPLARPSQGSGPPAEGPTPAAPASGVVLLTGTLGPRLLRRGRPAATSSPGLDGVQTIQEQAGHRMLPVTPATVH